MSRVTLRTGLLGITLAGLAILCCLAAAPDASAQAVSGTILGAVKDSSGRVVPGATVTLVHTGTGFSRTVVTRRPRRVHRAVAPDRHLHASPPSSRASRRSRWPTSLWASTRRCASTSSSRSARSSEVGRDPGRDAAAPDLVLGAGHDRRRGADQDAAAQRPQLRQPDPHRARRRCAASPARTSTARAASPGAPRRRSRPTASGRATTTTCSTASTTTRPGCRRS